MQRLEGAIALGEIRQNHACHRSSSLMRRCRFSAALLKFIAYSISTVKPAFGEGNQSARRAGQLWPRPSFAKPGKSHERADR
jgi:hypothetical protein